MTRVSRNPLTQDIWEGVKDDLAKLISILSDKNLVQGFFDDFLTPTEKVMLAKRLGIAVLLIGGFGYDEIKEILHVSTSTIFTVQNAVEKGKFLKPAVEDLLRIQRKEKDRGSFFEKAKDSLRILVVHDRRSLARAMNPFSSEEEREFEAYNKSHKKAWETAWPNRMTKI
jgi:uncharacterized protein YerC